MALRKASSYSHFKARPYTRKSRVRTKSYIKTVPPKKLVKLHMGNIQAFEQGKFPLVFHLITLQDVQVRDNAIEAARQSLHKDLETSFLGQYYFGVKVFPHHILRENKMITGAGADRMQTGMTHSFGATIGRAAMVRTGHDIFVFAVNSEKAAKFLRESVSKIKAKLPCSTRLVQERVQAK